MSNWPGAVPVSGFRSCVYCAKWRTYSKWIRWSTTENWTSTSVEWATLHLAIITLRLCIKEFTLNILFTLQNIYSYWILTHAHLQVTYSSISRNCYTLKENAKKSAVSNSFPFDASSKHKKTEIKIDKAYYYVSFSQRIFLSTFLTCWYPN